MQLWLQQTPPPQLQHVLRGTTSQRACVVHDCRMQRENAVPKRLSQVPSCISLPIEQHMPEGSSMPLGVGGDSRQSAHMIMHLVW